MTTESVIAWLREHAGHSKHLCLDSRQILPGDVFFACPGLASDGRQYFAQAIDRGACAIVMESGWDRTLPPDSIPVLEIDDLKPMLGGLAHEWYGRPSAALSVVAVTGTNGKTTTVQWLAAALNAQGIRSEEHTSELQSLMRSSYAVFCFK